MSRATIERPRESAKKGISGSQIRTFRQAVNYLNSLTNYERVSRSKYTSNNFNLARTTRLLSALGNPHRSFKSVHIAGTKGKGSTATMLTVMLREAGMKIGLYTSPHILDVRERICVDSDMISESAFAKAVANVTNCLVKARVAQPTYFEVLTAAAFSYFAEQDIDLAVVEVGMGGRLDCTNVIAPEVIGLTSISYDHMAQLGHTLEEIAREKAGVFKKGIPIVSAPQPEAIKDILRDSAEAVGAPLRYSNEGVDFSYRFEHSRTSGRHARICLTTSNCKFEHLRVPLLGAHQASNCCLALNLLDTLKSRGFDIDDQVALGGLNHVSLRGRMETISEDPRMIVDGAHNAASIDALMRAIGQHITYDSMVVIFGCQKDKDITGMLRRLQVGADKMIFTNSGSPRSADPKELAAMYTEASGKMAQVAQTLEEAVTIALSAISREDLVCITGSFYIVAEAMRKFSTTGR